METSAQAWPEWSFGTSECNDGYSEGKQRTHYGVLCQKHFPAEKWLAYLHPQQIVGTGFLRLRHRFRPQEDRVGCYEDNMGEVGEGWAVKQLKE